MRVAEPTGRSIGGLRRLWIAIAFSLLLIPSGYFAFTYRAMPHLGSYHDDAVYWISAESLAQGHGYRIAHLPENPPQTKYPPLYPALLSLLWRANGVFPDNLPPLMAVQWCLLPLYFALVWRYFERCGYRGFALAGLTAILALGPMTTIFAVSPMTELPFSVVLLGIMLVLERDEISTRRALLAGVLAAAAFLIRTNAVVLLVSVPVLFLLRRKVRPAIAFAAPLLASVIGWQGWAALHTYRASDDILSYYTSYVGYYVRTFSLADLPNRLWVNFDAVIEWLARLVLFHVGDEFWIRPLAWVLTAAAVSGVVQLWRRGIRQYPLFAVLFIGILLFWQYPPDQRFVYPLLPLYVAGLVTKLVEVGSLAIVTWRTKKGADRVAAPVMLALIFAVAAGSAGAMLQGTLVLLPDYFNDRVKQQAEMMPVYKWILANTAATDRFAAYDDTLLYLYSGRQGYTVPVLPRLVYDANPEAIKQFVLSLPSLWSAKQVKYLMVTAYDFRRDLHTPGQDSLNLLVQDRARFQPVYQDPIARVYRFSSEPRP